MNDEEEKKIDQRVWEHSEEIKWQAEELERIRGTGRDYRPHDDPEVPAHSRFLMNLKIQNVGKWLEPGDANRNYFVELAKDPARVRKVARIHAYGLQWFKLTLKDVFRMHNVFWDDEDDEKTQPPPQPGKKSRTFRESCGEWCSSFAALLPRFRWFRIRWRSRGPGSTTTGATATTDPAARIDSHKKNPDNLAGAKHLDGRGGQCKYP